MNELSALNIPTNQKKYRIAILAACPFPTSQGSQVLIRQLAETLHQRGHEVHVLAYHFGEHSDEPIHFYLHRITQLIPYNKLRAGPSFRKPLLDILLAVKLVYLIKHYKIDIIHAHNYEGLFVGFIAKQVSGVPVVYHSHNAMTDELHTYFQSATVQALAHRFAGFLDRQLPRRADHCIALNEELASYFREHGVASDRISCIAPGTFINEFKTRHLSAMFAKYNLRGRKVIIYTGNLDAYQNLELLFAAMTIICSQEPSVLLLLVSHSPPGHFAQLVHSLALDKYVRFIHTNSFPEVVDLLAASQVAVIPRTSWSGFPIKLINYMAARKAIVASQGSAKHLTHLENGYIVPDYNVPLLAEGVLLLLRSPELRERLGQNAAKTVRLKHDWNTLCQSIEAIYDTLVESRKR